MSQQSGCGPLGCLFRGILWLVGSAVAVVLLAGLVLAGIWYSGPRPAPASLVQFCTGRSVGFIQFDLDPARPAARELLRVIDDSIARPRVEHMIDRSPGFLKPLARAWGALVRRYIVPHALPFSVGASFYRASPPRKVRLAAAVNSRVPLRVLDLLGVTTSPVRLPSRSAPLVAADGQSYPAFRAGRVLMARYDNWLLLSDSAATLVEALSGAAGDSAVPDEFRRLARDPGRGAASAVFVNQGEELYELLNAAELELLRVSSPADREIVARLFARVLPLTGSVLTATAGVEFPDLDSGRVALKVLLQSAAAAAQFASALQSLKPFLDTVLARANQTFEYKVTVNGSLLELTGTFSGLRVPLTRLLTQRAR